MYKGRYFIRESIYVCGDYMDADIYPVFQPAGKRRKRCRPTSEIQKKLNQKNAKKKITRLAHANFTKDDIALHLTYDIEPKDVLEARKDLYNFIRRVKRQRKKAGLTDLKYLSCTEAGKQSGRVHHHLILSGGLDRDTLEKLWGKGYANSKRLQFREDGITGLARYMAKDRQFYRRWNQSKNLTIPRPIVRDGAMSREEVKEFVEVIEKNCAYGVLEDKYPFWELIDIYHEKNRVNHEDYISFEMRRREERHGNLIRGIAIADAKAGSG